MEELKTKAEKISSHVKEYVETLFKLSITKVSQKIVQHGSVVLTGIILIFILVMAVFFLSIGLGFWLGDLLNNRVYGFLMVGGMYLFLALVLFLLRGKTILPVLRNIIVRMIYD